MPTCKKCQEAFFVSQEEQAFLGKIAFTFGATVIHPPEPVYCPTCRMLLRTCNRNERFFYKNASKKSGKELISLYAKEPPWGVPFAIYEQKEWESDAFDPLEYGRDFDFSRPFFDQFSELLKTVPRMALCTIGNENCTYTTGTGYCRNCYLINSSEYCEDCYYGKLLQSSKDCVDCSYTYNSELCYECFSIHKCYHCTALLFSQNCQDCLYSSNLNACKHCSLCTNLHQKEYYFLNEPLEKMEYEKKIAEFWGSAQKMREMREKLMSLREQQPQRYANIVNSQHCTGDFIENSKNCLDCYDVNESEDCRYVQVGVQVKDNFDCSNMYIKPELCYETLGTIEVFNTAYSIFIFHSQNLLYCDYCYHSSDCFGCSGLTRKKYCIFNKQYTKGEYEELVPKIIEHMQKTGEWGLFFPPRYAPFAYNESLASEYVPLSKDEVLQRGFLWRDRKDEIPNVEKVIPGKRLPDRIANVPDDVLNWAIECEETGRPFQIIKPELRFYRSQNLPLPRLHPDVRYDRRLALRNPRTLYARTCAKCEKEIQTAFSPGRSETIYCEECYLKEVY
ncbi:hypothetical protein COU80_02720 [Candidatus Peregrinibacteria bacterium CG10_big_fil_rev_8_21_14_0_10_55_24]|nr:MAG: hypothetical protein COU80_02720 [Candidatus Peregrinibacteria bacterium CG10_big_fil_rev_8_21_14_0_10_55_24]